MFEYNSKHYGTVLINPFNIGTFRFGPILEMLQDPSLHTEALDDIQMLTFACFGRAERVLDTARFGFRFISEQQREPLQAYIDLFGEAATVLECIAYIAQLQSLGGSKNPETIRRIVEIAKEVFSTWPTAAEDHGEVASASVEAIAATPSSRQRPEDVRTAPLQERKGCETRNGSTSLNDVKTSTAITAGSGASLHHVDINPEAPMIPSRKERRVTWENDDEGPERGTRHVLAEVSNGEAGEASNLAPGPSNDDASGVCNPAPNRTIEPPRAELPPCERSDPSNNHSSLFGLSSPLAFRGKDPSTAAGRRLSFVGRVLPPFYYVSKTYKEMKLQLSQDTYFTVMIRNDSMMYYSVQHQNLANLMIPMLVRNVRRGRGADCLLFDGQSSLEPIGKEYTVEQVFELNDAYDREFRT